MQPALRWAKYITSPTEHSTPPRCGAPACCRLRTWLNRHSIKRLAGSPSNPPQITPGALTYLLTRGSMSPCHASCGERAAWKGQACSRGRRAAKEEKAVLGGQPQAKAEAVVQTPVVQSQRKSEGFFRLLSRCCG